MAAALAVIPFLLQTLGTERFGVMSLIWVVVGYFSFLDMGLGRAVTVTVAIAHAKPRTQSNDEGRHTPSEVLQIVSTATVFLGVAASIFASVAALGIFLFGCPVNFSTPDLNDEVWLALLWMLPSLPLLLVASSLRGFLEGVGAFKALNMLRIPTGVMLVLGPALTAWVRPNLVWATAGLLLIRLLHVAALFWMVNQKMVRKAPVSSYYLPIAMTKTFSKPLLRHLLSFGGWATVSNVAGPMIVYVDRFVIAATLGASAVAVYTVPFDVVARLPILVASICSVLLPVMAQLSSARVDSRADIAGGGFMHQGAQVKKLSQLVLRASFLSAGIMGPLVLCACLAAPWGLHWWLGEALSPDSVHLTQVLLLAFGVNAMAQIPFTALQAARQVKSVAILHLCELLPYAGLVYLAVSHGGLAGAAYAWLLRGLVDYLMLIKLWRSHVATQV